VRRLLAFLALSVACAQATLTEAPPGGGITDPTADGDGGVEPTPVESGSWGDPKTTRRAGLLRLGQLNTRRYFDTKCDSNNCASGGYEDVPTPAAFTARTAQIAAGIARLQADIVTLEEVESDDCINALQKKLESAGYVYPVAKLTPAGGPGNVNVALLARGSLDSVKLNRQANPLTRPDGTSTTFTREFPEMHLTLGSTKVIVFPAHFRSKVDDDPGRRLAEGQKAQELVTVAGTTNASSLVLLAGDLNDMPGSPPLLALEKDGALLRVAKDIPEAAQGTLAFNGQVQAIDHIFVTHEHAGDYVARSATVVRDDGQTTGGLGGSDHAGIYADFKTK
jgi:predicted extracellular nuclease